MNEDLLVKDVYNKISYHFNDTRVQKWNWITEYLNNLKKNSTVLDLGCGTGRNMLYSNINFIGLDNCENFIKICKLKKLTVIEGDMCKIPLKNDTIDHVISIASFHHLISDSRRNKCLQEVYRVLKKNGTVLLSVWSINQPEKTRRQFFKYGDTIVNWNKFGKVFERYYYIFQINEIKNLFIINNFEIINHKWDCGNEIFILKKNL